MHELFVELRLLRDRFKSFFCDGKLGGSAGPIVKKFLCDSLSETSTLAAAVFPRIRKARFFS